MAGSWPTLGQVKSQQRWLLKNALTSSSLYNEHLLCAWHWVDAEPGWGTDGPRFGILLHSVHETPTNAVCNAALLPQAKTATTSNKDAGSQAWDAGKGRSSHPRAQDSAQSHTWPPGRMPNPPPLSPGRGSWGGDIATGSWPKSPALRAGPGGCGEPSQHPTLHGCPPKTGRAGPSQAGGSSRETRQTMEGPPARKQPPRPAQDQALCLGAHRPRDTGSTEHWADGARGGDARPPAGPDTAWEREPLSRCLKDAIRLRQTNSMVGRTAHPRPLSRYIS